LLVTGDTNQDRDIFLGAPMEIIVAYQSTFDSDAVKHTDRSIAYVDFGSGNRPVSGGNTISTTQINAANYDYSIAILLGNCGLYWKIRSNVISIGLECFNTGWIGLGISNQNGGGMNASDIW
jgi:hypothetical protein